MKDKEDIERELYEAIDDFTGNREVHTPHLIKRLMEIFDKDIASRDKTIAEQAKEIEELKAAIKGLIQIAERVRITVENPNWKQEFILIKEIMDRSKALIRPSDPQPQEQQPQPSTP